MLYNNIFIKSAIGIAKTSPKKSKKLHAADLENNIHMEMVIPYIKLCF